MNSKLIGYILTRCPEDSNGQVQMSGDVVREILAALRAPAGVQAWVGLTDKEILSLGWMDYMTRDEEVALIREVEAKLREKNGG